MAVTKQEVEKLAELARLEFNENEIENLTKDMNQILHHMDKLNELDTSNVEPLSHPIEVKNVFREDELIESIKREDALKNAPDNDDEFFKVPKVIG